MKRLFLFNLFIIFICSSCVEFDNYDEPEETLKGVVINKNTQQGLQTQIGDKGIRVKLMELSWSDNPTPYYFYVMQDGTFNNTKIFKANYNISVEGAFVPLVQTDSQGNTIVDNTVTRDVKGTVEQNFEVEPFLDLEWIGEPLVNAADSSITITVKMTRGTANPAYQQNITDLVLFVSQGQYVGENEYDDRYTTKLDSYNGSSLNSVTGQILTIKTKQSLPPKRDWFIRIGARIDKEIAGVKRYNYNQVKRVPFMM